MKNDNNDNNDTKKQSSLIKSNIGKILASLNEFCFQTKIALFELVLYKK